MRFFLAGVAVWMSVAATASLGASFPDHAMADSGRLLSRVAPVSGKGSPAQQTRQAIDALWKRDRDAQIVKLRVFVNDPSVSSSVSAAIVAGMSHFMARQAGAGQHPDARQRPQSRPLRRLQPRPVLAGREQEAHHHGGGEARLNRTTPVPIPPARSR